MTKRKRTSKLNKWIKEGRGIGSGEDYQPWLKIQDVSSLGQSTTSLNTSYNLLLSLFIKERSIKG